MVTKSLSEIIRFTLGKNPTRIRESDINLYTPEDFENDLHGENESQDNLGCVINLIRSKAAPYSKNSKEKLITSNFISCEFDQEKLDPWFFCYQFNEGKSFEQQIGMYHQGTTLSVKKLNVKIIGELKIILPDIKKQKSIGQLYRQSIVQNDLLLKQAEEKNNFIMTVIRKIEED